MGFLGRIIFSYLSNLIALVIAGNLVPGFGLTGDFVNLLITAGVFTVINLYIRPLVKMILSPAVILTLGLFSLVINAGMLYLLDILSQNVNISGIEPLVYGTLIITAVNLLFGFSKKAIFN